AHQQPSIKREKTIFLFFRKRDHEDASESLILDSSKPSGLSIESPIFDSSDPSISRTVEQSEREFDVSSIERDLGLKKQICEYPVHERDEIRRAYIKERPYQPKLAQYLKTKVGNQYHCFQYNWFKKYPWLEYVNQYYYVSEFCYISFIVILIMNMYI